MTISMWGASIPKRFCQAYVKSYLDTMSQCKHKEIQVGNSIHYGMHFEATVLSYAMPTLFQVVMMIDIRYK